MTCLDPKYRIAVQCQNIVYVLNEHETVQQKLMTMIKVKHIDIIEELFTSRD